VLKTELKSISGYVLLYLVALLVFLLPVDALAEIQLDFQWEPNSEPDLAGYRVFSRLGGQGYDYGEPVWEGNETTCTISIADEYATHYFVVRAYDIEGFESEDSNEAIYAYEKALPEGGDTTSVEDPTSDIEPLMSDSQTLPDDPPWEDQELLVNHPPEQPVIEYPQNTDIEDPDTPDGNGGVEPESDGMIALDTIIGQGRVYLYADECSGVLSIDSIICIDPNITESYLRPNLSLGIFYIKLSLDFVGGTVIIPIYFSDQATDDARWYTHDKTAGWQDYSNHSTFSDDGMSGVLEFKDGGYGDADGMENGIIISTFGLGNAPHPIYSYQGSSATASDDPDSGGGGCFITVGVGALH